MRTPLEDHRSYRTFRLLGQLRYRLGRTGRSRDVNVTESVGIVIMLTSCPRTEYCSSRANPKAPEASAQEAVVVWGQEGLI